MPLDRSKFKNIVGGITTPVQPEAPAPVISPTPLPPEPEQPSEVGAGQGAGHIEPAREPAAQSEKPATPPAKRFAKTGRPRGQTTGKSNKEKISLYIDKTLIDEIYDWAYQDRIQPGEMIERALRAFRDREAKRRNSGTE